MQLDAVIFSAVFSIQRASDRKTGNIICYLTLCSLVGRIELNNSLEVVSRAVELFHTKQRLPSSEQSFLVGGVDFESLKTDPD